MGTMPSCTNSGNVKKTPMASKQLFLIAALLLACVGLPACGTTGKTSTFVLDLDPPQTRQVISGIRVKSAAMDPDAAVLNAVNVQPWGKFDADDLRNVEQSLRDTIAPHVPATTRPAEAALDIHVMIRRYVVGVSNTGGAVLVNVTWAATDSEGKLVFKEQFYASDSVYLIGTIGLLKDSVHQAIVRRIATTSLVLASSPEATGARPVSFENTYATFEEAAARLPQTMVSMGNPGLMASPHRVVGAVGLLTPSGISRIQWGIGKPSADFDWQGYLEALNRAK